MSEIKNLIEPKSHDPYNRYNITEYLSCIKESHLEFFKYMAETGFEKYTTPAFLRKTIREFSTKLFDALKEQDASMVQGRNYTVAPNLTDENIQDLIWKWQGNVMEIISGWMFQKCNPFADRYVFDEMCGDDKNDVGVDGWMRSTTNRLFFIAVQVKYRFEKEVKWNDQITKAIALTDERVRKLYQANQLTDEEWCKWGKQIQRRAILVTTTSLSNSVTEAIGTDAFDVVDEKILLKYLGMEKNTNPNKIFWQSLYDYLMA